MHLLNSDFMYAFFCFGAAIFVSLSTLRLLKQKQVRGVNFLEPMWFLGWGFVNLYVFWGYSLSFISSISRIVPVRVDGLLYSKGKFVKNKR
jgi:hypothetical protein